MKRLAIQTSEIDELLKRVRRRLTPEGVWTQRHQAENSNGDVVKTDAADAVQWDVLGALRVESIAMLYGPFAGRTRDLYDAAASKLAEALVYHLDCRRVSRDAPTALAFWNDADERTQDDVLNLFAIAA